MKHLLPLAAAMALLTACTSVNVHPVANDLQLKEVCIVNNTAVIVPGFVTVLQNRFRHHGIETRMVEATDKDQCSYYLEYSARQSWDVTPYLSWAELKLYSGGGLLADAEYKLIGKGGLSLTKWQSAETKMTPVIDSLLGKK